MKDKPEQQLRGVLGAGLRKKENARFVSAEFIVEVVDTTMTIGWSGIKNNGLWMITMRRAFHHPRFLELRLSPGYRNAEKIANRYKMRKFEV